MFTCWVTWDQKVFHLLCVTCSPLFTLGPHVFNTMLHPSLFGFLSPLSTLLVVSSDKWKTRLYNIAVKGRFWALDQSDTPTGGGEAEWIRIETWKTLQDPNANVR